MDRRDFFKLALGGLAGAALIPLSSVVKVIAKPEIKKDCCAGCGKSLLVKDSEKPPKTYITNTDIECLTIDMDINKMAALVIRADGDTKYGKFLKRQLGKYEVGKEYEFCWECLLNSLVGLT